MRSIRIAAFALGLFVGDGVAASTLAAQRASQHPSQRASHGASPGLQDTVVAKLVLSRALEKMGSALVDALYTRQLTPWEITLPSTPGWSGMVPRIRHLLFARAPTPTDDAKRYFRITVTSPADTLRLFSVVIGSTWRCPGNSTTWLMGEREFDVRIALRDRRWEDATEANDLDVIADPSVCP